MSVSLEKASDLTWNWWGSIRIAFRLENSYIWYLWMCLVCGKLGFSECHFTYGISLGTNPSVWYNWAVDGSWIIMWNLSGSLTELGHRTEWIGCFFCVYPFSISFLWCYTHLVYVYIIYCILFLKVLSICIYIYTIYMYICTYIFTLFFFKV